MAAISWAFGVSGDWSNGAYWTGGVAPGPGDDVTIDAAHSLVLDDAGATLALSNGGALTIGSTLEVAAGTLQLNQGGSLTLGSTLDVVGGTVLLSGGVINGGTLSADGGSFVWNLEGSVWSRGETPAAFDVRDQIEA